MFICCILFIYLVSARSSNSNSHANASRARGCVNNNIKYEAPDSVDSAAASPSNSPPVGKQSVISTIKNMFWGPSKVEPSEIPNNPNLHKPSSTSTANFKTPFSPYPVATFNSLPPAAGSNRKPTTTVPKAGGLPNGIY